jgi:hypothetical protein
MGISKGISAPALHEKTLGNFDCGEKDKMVIFCLNSALFWVLMGIVERQTGNVLKPLELGKGAGMPGLIKPR